MCTKGLQVCRTFRSKVIGAIYVSEHFTMNNVEFTPVTFFTCGKYQKCFALLAQYSFYQQSRLNLSIILRELFFSKLSLVARGQASLFSAIRYTGSCGFLWNVVHTMYMDRVLKGLQVIQTEQKDKLLFLVLKKSALPGTNERCSLTSLGPGLVLVAHNLINLTPCQSSKVKQSSCRESYRALPLGLFPSWCQGTFMCQNW